MDTSGSEQRVYNPGPELDKALSIKNDPDSSQEKVNDVPYSNLNELQLKNYLFQVDLLVKREPDLNEQNSLPKDDLCHSELILKDDFDLIQDLNIKCEHIKCENQENIVTENYNSLQENITFEDNIDKHNIDLENRSELKVTASKKKKPVNANLVNNTDFKIKTVRDLRRLSSKNYEQYGTKDFEKVNSYAESLPNLQNNNYKKDKVELICDLCGKGFRNKVPLIRHIRRHTNKCKVCRKVFSLQSHTCKPKLPQKTHKCDHCKKIFKRVDNLRNHIRKHTGEKPFICQLCDKDFKEYSSLKKHIRIHTGEKPYQCNHCKKGFTRSDHLQKHSLTHSGVKPHKCDICDRSFSQSGTLRDHKRTHTGEKPYKCYICGKAFSKAANMKNHVRNLHPSYSAT